MARTMALVAGVMACRIGFEARENADGATNDGLGDVTCAPHPMLGASGCLTGTGPYGLWVFYEDQGPIVPDVSGRGCTRLMNAGLPTVAGLDVSIGVMSSVPGDAMAMLTTIVTAGQVTFEIWGHTTNEPSTDVDIGAIRDMLAARVR